MSVDSVDIVSHLLARVPLGCLVVGPVLSEGGEHLAVPAHGHNDDDDDDDDDDDEVPLEVETVMRKSLAEGGPVTVTRGTGELRLRSTAWTRDTGH